MMSNKPNIPVLLQPRAEKEIKSLVKDEPIAEIMVNVECKRCGCFFEAKEADSKKGHVTFCSNNCKNNHHKTGKRNNRTIRPYNRNEFRKVSINDLLANEDEFF